ncbi:MAG: alkaline phosphatase family protein [Gemmatimonadaceae bacterium]
MHYDSVVRRVVVVILDGLRPDAIQRFNLETLHRVMASGAWTLRGTTVAPSVTTAAVTSLMTGVSPGIHGLAGDHLFIPRAKQHLTPLPRQLATRGLPSSGFMGQVPAIFRGVAARVGRRLGLDTLRLAGDGAAQVLNAARPTLASQRSGLILLHWADADRAGHDHGWMSPAYADGCRRMDDALAELVALADDSETLIVGLADHGGGGRKPNDHESDHALDRTIPIVLFGANVVPRGLGPARLLDVPPTILSALGVDIPHTYEGRVLWEAFAADERLAAAVVA